MQYYFTILYPTLQYFVLLNGIVLSTEDIIYEKYEKQSKYNFR